MRLYRGLGILGITLLELVGPSAAQAATASCMSPDGSCEVSNDAGDTVTCECANGIGGAGGGGNEWAGLSELELQPICDEQLALFCGPPPPPMGIPCMSAAGTCVIDNVPEDSLTCECFDGSGGGMVGGNAWAGLSDMELLMQCELELAGFCGGPPPPPVLECSSRLGACSIASEPLDFLVCECSGGTAFEGGGGNDWAGLSDEELLALCEDALADGCAVGGETGGEETGGEETGGAETGGAETGAGSEGTGGESTGGPGETGADDSGGASEGSGGEGPEPATTGDDATGGSSEGSGGEGGGSGGGGGCSVAPRSASSGLALALLGLLALGRRRRRAA